MQTIKTATVRLDAQEVDYVKLLQEHHKEEYKVNLSQSDLFRMLLREKAQKIQLPERTSELRHASFIGRMRDIIQNKK